MAKILVGYFAAPW